MPDETTDISAFVEWARKQEMSLRACGSDNRAKSMSCETCPHWDFRNAATCMTCYWHNPENYQHVATVDERRLTITARGGHVATMDALTAEADAAGLTLGELVLDRLSNVD